ncbi:MAG: methionyl-tRNA formyltransferase [Candidatus Roizmanbacteria bacterium]
MITILYFGTPSFSANLLDNLIKSELDVKISGIVTQPDKPVGRKKILTPSPVKIYAQKYEIPVFENSEHAKAAIENADLCIVYAYGNFISQETLDLPRYGFWNIHPSLLPKYRGATPMTFPLLLATTTTGVSLMKMDHLMDHGPIIAQEPYKLSAETTRLDLEDKLTQIGSDLLITSLRRLIEEGLSLSNFVEQDHVEKSVSLLLKKDDGFVSEEILKMALSSISSKKFDLPPIYLRYQEKNPEEILPLFTPAEIIWNMYRALTPWPGVWTIIDNKRMKLLDLEYREKKIILKTVQTEGKNPTPFSPGLPVIDLL